MILIGEKIRELRQIRGVSQRNVAAHLNMSTSIVSKIEIGMVEIRLSRLQQIAAYFDMSAATLITWENNDGDLLNEPQELIAAKEKILELELEIKNLQALIISIYTELENSFRDSNFL